jgi:hypothetical protein
MAAGKSYSIMSVILGAFLATCSTKLARAAEADLKCPKDFNFQEATADVLTRCMKSVSDWISGIEARVDAIEKERNVSKRQILSIGAVVWQSGRAETNIESGAGAKLASDDNRGRYRLLFDPNLQVDAVVLVSAIGEYGKNEPVVCTSTSAGRSEFQVECKDKGGWEDSAFWFVVLSK